MTNFFIITSTEDKASMTMRNVFLKDKLMKFDELNDSWHDHPILQLKEVIAMKDYGPFFKDNHIYLGLTDSPLIHLDDLMLQSSNLKVDLLIFASRHRSEAGKPAFLTHSTGNWNDEAKYGGNPKEISSTSAILLKSALNNLIAQNRIKNIEGFKVDMEVTHHGPTILEKPLIFMELGSSEEEWEIEDAAKVVAHAILNTCYDYAVMMEKKPPKIGIGFGGTHYAPQFRKLVTNSNVAISFICPKYYIQNLDDALIKQMIAKTHETVDFFIIDWKGTNSDDKSHLMPLLEKYDVPIKKTKDF